MCAPVHQFSWNSTEFEYFSRGFGGNLNTAAAAETMCAFYGVQKCDLPIVLSSKTFTSNSKTLHLSNLF